MDRRQALREPSAGTALLAAEQPIRKVSGGEAVNEWLRGYRTRAKVCTAASLPFAMAAMLSVACNSAAEMRYWCLTQANRAVSESASDSEAHERLVREMSFSRAVRPGKRRESGSGNGSGEVLASSACPLATFPYSVFNVIRDDAFDVLAGYHARRRPRRFDSPSPAPLAIATSLARGRSTK